MAPEGVAARSRYSFRKRWGTVHISRWHPLGSPPVLSDGSVAPERQCGRSSLGLACGDRRTTVPSFFPVEDLPSHPCAPKTEEEGIKKDEE